LELVRPRAFFGKYGDYLLQTMLMVKYGRLKTGSLKTPYLSFQSQTGLDHVPGIQVLQTGLPRQNVEIHLNLMIRHLQSLRSTTNDTHNTAHDVDSTSPSPRKPFVPLQYSDLTQLQSYSNTPWQLLNILES
ncbi:hypothetical protein BGZ91_004851, partial [Linnemannia elongata]